MKIKKILSIMLVMLLAFSMLGAASGKTPAKVSGVKATAAKDTSISISWNKAKYAQKYEVKYKTSSASSWKSYKTTGKKATIKNLKQNTKYQFKVRGINGSKKGSFSKTLTQQTYIMPAKVKYSSIFAMQRSKSEIKIAWNKAKNASYYEIATTKLNSDYTDYQNCDYQQISENKYVSLPEFTTKTRMRPNTWYQFKVRSVYNKTGKFQVIRSAWSAPFYACTTSGDRIITGTKSGNVIRYNMDDIFTVCVDDALVPTGVYEISSYPENYYENDFMTVSGVKFPSNFNDLREDEENIDENLNGKTYRVGDTFEGYTIQSIVVFPCVSDQGATNNYSVSFTLSNGYAPTVSW